VIRLSVRIVVVLLFGLVGEREAAAFPGMIRHGYVHCTACHVSPSGGGVLNAYGRELSQEVLSFRSNPDEGKFLANLIPSVSEKIPENVLFGGDVRVLALGKDNSVFREQRLSLMQADIEAAVRLGQWTFDASIGYYDGEGKSLRHYVLYQASDAFGVRAGRFMTNFGINTSEHTITTRRNLGFDQSSETYNLEASWLGERGSVFATAIFGKPESVATEDGLTIGRTGYAEKGGALRGSFFLGDRHELGASLLRASNDFATRSVAGPFFILGFTPRLFLQSEIDLQWSTPTGSTTATFGGFHAHRLDYEPVQGWHAYLLQELARPSFANAATRTSRTGIGMTVYPRPHYEIDLRWYRQHSRPDVEQLSTFAWLLLHYYW
jgi:hypothetical protein